MNKREQFAVFEKVPAHGSEVGGIILGPFNSEEEATEAGNRYGYNTDNYYVDKIKVMETKKLTKEEFLEKLKTDRDFNNRYGRKHITEGKMVLPPCHYGFQVYTRELSEGERYQHLRTGKYSAKWDGVGDGMEYYDSISVPKRAISLMWNQRSVDTFLGLPFNIASYALLLEIYAFYLNMVPDELIGNLGDTHLYLNHLDQAMEQIGRELTDEERYDIWFKENYETGMEKNFSPDKLPNYDHPYYTPTPKRTREPFELPKLMINSEFWPTKSGECGIGELHEDFGFLIRNLQIDDFSVINYKSHPKIKADLSN